MTGRSILLKLQPNQDVTLGLEAAIGDAGFARAQIRAAVGSITRGVLQREGVMECVEGPAIEVAALTGEICADGSTAALFAHLCMTDGSVVSGHLARGLNAVAVTFELLIEDAAP